ncbi:hypothetical protein Ctob_004660 [Chrysochromulina tobinii]|uniref:Uncharacterized protein n=1 Tax=Chrysochromulina tobinii TaxID=1460289 RepID=A0A0M0JP08_9EUKA|nr:hypothetical protein Ctob_004660 [Chrysochromulina tobinii]|eukprot:KOO28336.1 hypothetical protein Ctob_004660 [Chrysochromulina sp. CCMP291]
MRILASPPPPHGPPMLLRNGLEAACLRFQEPLELLARAVCDFDRVEQRFVWDGATRTLRYARDTSQCVDYFTSLRDFGVWSCFDAANDEFFYDAPAARYCLLLDHDKCVRTVTGEADEAVQLRVPGEATCLRLDEAQTPLSRHTCDDTRLSQRWRYEPALAAFRSRWIFHSATATFRPAIDAGLCLDLFQAGHMEAEAAEGGAQAQAFVGADALRAALSGGGGSDELTLDGGGALGAPV